eukprot:TRINITY_DN1539_c0_g1_i1.p1 TRINITY_DN1539_c0_g1~~TRINITY_DN1539_c0_g1_i1.p1  ORF type:complete len:306 (-),score=94.70 TRINITY_DN1539_c0_g1_i1:37-954(-)
MSLDIRVKRVDRIYRPGENVSGVVIVSTASKLSHSGIRLVLEGVVNLKHSEHTSGILDSMNNAVKPFQNVFLTIDLVPPGKFEAGETQLPFEFKLEAMTGQTLYETYNGVFISILYFLRADMPRPLLAKNLQKQIEFVVEIKNSVAPVHKPIAFTITPEELDNVKKTSIKHIPKFKLTGIIDSSVFNINKPFTGELTLEESEVKIKSIEIQLVRVETCGTAEGFSKESTEIQNIQVADGDIPHGISVPLFMIFPRLFTCPTLHSKNFKIDFEVNIVVLLTDSHLVTRNFPINLVRCDDQDSIGSF